MKNRYIPLILFLSLLAGGYNLVPTSGGSSHSNTLLIPRNPFYRFIQSEGVILLNITHPLNQTYHRNTLWLNTTIISPATPPYRAYYRVNGLAWNEYHCLDNGYCFQHVTFPEFDNVVDVLVFDEAGRVGRASVAFYIDLFTARLLTSDFSPGWYVIAFVMLFVFWGGHASEWSDR